MIFSQKFFFFFFSFRDFFRNDLRGRLGRRSGCLPPQPDGHRARGVGSPGVGAAGEPQPTPAPCPPHAPRVVGPSTPDTGGFGVSGVMQGPPEGPTRGLAEPRCVLEATAPREVSQPREGKWGRETGTPSPTPLREKTPGTAPELEVL